MKKLLIISSIVASMAVSSANAKDNAYVGFVLLASHAKNETIDLNSGTNAGKSSQTAAGLGLNAGYKIGFNNGLFIAPEAFFDYLNNKDTDKQDKNNTYTINSRYGAKLNLGYDLNDKFSVFANYGLANVGYQVSLGSSNESHGASKIAAIYGLGVAYNINEQLTVKLGANRQDFNTRGVDQGIRIKNVIKTYSVGLAYNF